MTPVIKLNVTEGFGELKTHLLVDLRAVVVAFLACARYSASHTGGMPGADARHFPQSLVGLPGKLLRVPAAGHTCNRLWVSLCPVQHFKRVACLPPLKP